MLFLAGILTALSMCWLVSAVRGHRLKEIPGRAALAAAFLLSAGWLVVLSGPHFTPEAFDIEHFSELSGRWPSSFLSRTQVEAMWMTSGLVLVFLFLVDPYVFGVWRGRFYEMMVTAGGALMLFGVWRVLVEAPLSAKAAPLAGNFFATFFDEGIGVAFVCLIWPLAAGGVIGRIGVPGALSGREKLKVTAWAAVILVGWLGLAVMGSLLGLLVSGGLAALFVLWVLWRVPAQALRTYAMRCGWIAAPCVAATAMGMLVYGRTPAFHTHWTRLQATLAAKQAQGNKPPEPSIEVRPDGLILSGENPDDANYAKAQRGKVLASGVRMIPQAGLLGFGPGAWPRSYPHFTDDALLRTYYLQMQFAYNDYLQVLVEWGVLGTMAWAVLFAGGIWGGVYRLRRYRSKGGRIGEKEGMIAGALGGLLGVLICAWWYPPLQVPSVQLYVAVLLGILWSAGERRGWSRGEGGQEVVSKAGAT